MDGWIEAARQRATDLIGANADVPVIAGLSLLLLAAAALTVMTFRRRGRSAPLGGGTAVGAPGPVEVPEDVSPRAETLLAECLKHLRSGPNADPTAGKRAERLEEQGRHLFLAATTLLGLAGTWSRSARTIEPALAALREGDTGPAIRVLSALAEAMAAEDAHDPGAGARLLRHLAALTCLHAPETALGHALKATELAPEHSLGWSLLGIIAEELGDHDLAQDACETVLKLGAGTGGQGLLAGAVGTLGEIHLARGQLERAEEAFRIALTYQAGLARPESMVRLYRNLAQVEMARRDWTRAGEIIDKAISLEATLGHRESMAELEIQAGLIAERCDDLSGAQARWAKARQIFDAIGTPDKAKALDRLIAKTVKSRAR